MTPDPYEASGGAEDPGSWNRYAYVLGDPVRYNDPNGLNAMETVYPDGSGGGGFTPTGTFTYYTYFQYGPEGNPVNGFVALLQGSSGTGGGGGGKTTPPSPPSQASLLESAKARVAAALLKKDCAKDFKNVSNVLKKLTTVDFSNQGTLRYVTVNGIEEAADNSPGVAIYNPFGRSINLNRSVNWSDPSKTARLLAGKLGTIDLLSGTAFELGVADVSAAQYMDLSILHELSHYNGALGNPDRDPSIERTLWTDCTK